MYRRRIRERSGSSTTSNSILTLLAAFDRDDRVTLWKILKMPGVKR